MKISARIANSRGRHKVVVTTDGIDQSIWIPSRESGFGSSINGGELLFLALATCYGNDIYREANRRGIAVACVEVDVEGQFGAEGEAATGITYHATVVAEAAVEEIQDLMRRVDQVAEIHNTLRASTPVTLASVEGKSIQCGDRPR